MICKMAKERKRGLMSHILKDHIRTGKKTGMGNINGQMDVNIKEIGRIINLMEREYTNGVMEDNTMGIG